MAIRLPERLFSADEYERMVAAGIFGADERLELLAGRIVKMPPIGPEHAWGVKRLIRVFAPLSGRVTLSVQDPIRLDDRSEPEPDLVLLRPGAPEDRHPRPEDIVLVVEVADTSLLHDRQVKVRLYANAGVPEYWIVNIGDDRVERYRDPSPTGYRLAEMSGRGQRVSPLFAPDLTIEIDAILGPA